jgi:hypothetical protein
MVTKRSISEAIAVVKLYANDMLGGDNQELANAIVEAYPRASSASLESVTPVEPLSEVASSDIPMPTPRRDVNAEELRKK